MKPWRSIELGNVVTFQRGFDLPHRHRKMGGVPIVSSAGVTDHHDAAMVSPPGVVTGRYGTIGELFYLEGPFWPLNTTLFVRDFHGNDPRFTFYLLHLFDFQVFSGKSGVPGVNRNDLHAERVTIPTNVAEQSAIASALSDVDALLSSLDALIAKKRDIKQAAMQQLLTGKIRLPGFESNAGFRQTEVGVIPKDWEVSTVGRQFDVTLGKMLDAEKNIGELKPYIGNRNVRWGSVSVSELPLMRLTRADMEKFRLRNGDLLVCEGGDVGRAAIWDAPVEECYYQKALHRLRPLRGFNSRLMVGLLRLWSDRGTLANYVTQTSIAHLPREKFMEIPMPVPSSLEQTAIAEVLAEMDAEQEVLEARRDKTRLLKQGMMQELLTGKTRLV